MTTLFLRQNQMRLTALAVLALIQGCGQTEPGRVASPAPVTNQTNTPNATHATNSMQNQPQRQHEQTWRVVVKFSSSGTGRESPLLAGLTRQAQAPVSFIASVAADTHVYRIEPASSQRAEDVLARLRAMPGVVFVELDSLARGL